MRGLSLHGNLKGATFVGAFRTAPLYRLYSIDDVHPGMFEVETGGVCVNGEIYDMSDAIWSQIEAGEPQGLYCGQIKLDDRQVVDGILYPRKLAENRHRDISEYGGWRAYVVANKRNMNRRL
jgi:gamma-glutamylaminecyclotransferase